MGLDPVVAGTQYTLALSWQSGDAYVPSAHRAQLTLDSPVGTPAAAVQRITRAYDPAGGSDAGVSAVGDDVWFTLSPADTAAMGAAPGNWTVVAAVGPSATQTPLVPVPPRAWAMLPVYAPPGGAVPHG